MSGPRISAPSTWPASAAALVVLATPTVGGGGWRPGFTADGLHPTAAAADAMAELALETLLGE